MKSEDLRGLLEPIGCWPPTCHGCDMEIGPKEEVTFGSVERKEDGKDLFAVLHIRCGAKKPKEPSALAMSGRRFRDGKRTGGAFVTLEELKGLS